MSTVNFGAADDWLAPVFAASQQRAEPFRCIRRAVTRTAHYYEIEDAQTLRRLAQQPHLPYFFSLNTAQSVLTPGAIAVTQLPDVDRLTIQAGRIGPVNITVQRWWDSQCPTSRLTPEQALTALENSWRTSAAFDALEPLTPELRNAQAEFEQSLTEEPHLLPATVRALHGLGPGLTPSGDDILAGASIALFAFTQHHQAGRNRYDELTQAIRFLLNSQPGRTTFVAAALLRAAMVGRAAGPLRRLCRSPGDVTALRALADIGHTSGRDTALGFRLALRAVSTTERMSI